MEDGFAHVMKKGMEHLEGVFLERKFDSDNLYVIHKKSKSLCFFSKSVMFLSVQLELKEGHFELTDEESSMITKYMELSNQASLF